LNSWQSQKIIKKHWIDNFGWTMTKFMHQEVMTTTKVIVGVIIYVGFSCDEVFTMDNQT
jgi:hypothetical protein